MVFDIHEVSGIGEYEVCPERDDEGNVTRELYKVADKVFMVLNKNTIEVRSDEKLVKLLTEKYESVMKSRYFGRGGVEIVISGQLSDDEIYDLVRLSYNLASSR